MTDDAFRLHLPAVVMVFAGGIAGACGRYLISEAWPASTATMPWSTLGINVAGAAVLGLLLEALLRAGPDVGRRRRLRLLLGAGFCGAFTTYSGFAVELAEMLRDGRPALAAGYAALALLSGMAAVAAGILAGRSLDRQLGWSLR